MGKKLGSLAAILLWTAMVLGMASCQADWWIGNDNGEAYERYIEEMHGYGMYPDIYGYGWGKEK